MTTFRTVRAALATPTFIIQAFLTIAINLLVNLGIPYATYSNWGARTHPGQFPSIGMWDWNYEVGSCIGMDILLTHFLLATMCTWASSGAAQKDVRERKCSALEPSALAASPWVYTPVNVRSLFWRGLAMGFYVTLLVGIPVLFLVWIGVRNGTWPGYSYVIIKGIWAGVFLAFPVYVLVFISAIDKRNFPEFEYSALASPGSSGVSEAVLDGSDKLGGYYGEKTPNTNGAGVITAFSG